MLPLLERWLGSASLGSTLALGVLLAARVLPLAILLPWMSFRGISPLLRTLFVLVLTLALFPIALGASSGMEVAPTTLAPRLLREVLVGSIFALSASLPVHALEWGGGLTDTWRGASLSEVSAPGAAGSTTPLGGLYRMLGVAVFITLGGHRLALRAFADSFVVVPLDAFTPLDSWREVALGMARLVGAALGLSAGVAAPAALLLVLGELSLALVGRAAPQVQVFFLGMPLRAALGIGATLVAIGVVMGRWPAVARSALESASLLVSALAG